ncbi:MAG: glycoside hydrolase family 3 N-terminal domain-containing protein, partial [Bacteroidota bacterium]
HIPLLFGYDVIHGAKTSFPIPLAEAASWDLDAIEKSARIAAIESSALGLHWTFAPMVDICRDPRWGRVMEGAGEDPYLGSQIAISRVKGFQGKDLAADDAIMACVKHFAGYGAVEAGRDYNTTTISIRNLREVYLPPFKAAVKAGAGSVMTAFNDLDGTPASANSFLIRDVLKKEWKFEGFVVSDWNSIGEIMNWGTAKDRYTAGEQAINAGTDMDMCGFIYSGELKKLVQDKKVSIERVDDAVRRVLKMKFSLGLFDNPYRNNNAEREKKLLNAQAHLEVSRDVARRSIVLLKNEKNILPLKKDIKSVLVVGEVASTKGDMSSTWSGMVDPKKNVTILDGIKAKLSASTQVMYSAGTDPKDETVLKLDTTLRLAEKADVIIMTMGERGWWVGENNSHANIGIRKNELAMMEALIKTGKPLVVLLTNGRPFIINEIAEEAPAVLETWWLGSQAGNAIADVLFGDYNPSGKLPMSFPRSIGQIPVYYAQRNTGRPYKANRRGQYDGTMYRDVVNSPLYPFGFGLSYTKFEYQPPVLSKDSISMDDEMTIKVKVKNVGKIDGEEVVQLYIRDMVASVSQPVKVLKGFRKVNIKAGETADISFTINSKDLSIWDKNMVFRAEPGLFKVMTGGDSDHLQEKSFYLK